MVGLKLENIAVKFAKQIIKMMHIKCTTTLIQLDTSKKYVFGIHTVHGEIQAVKIALKNIAKSQTAYVLPSKIILKLQEPLHFVTID